MPIYFAPQRLDVLGDSLKQVGLNAPFVPPPTAGGANSNGAEP